MNEYIQAGLVMLFVIMWLHFLCVPPNVQEHDR